MGTQSERHNSRTRDRGRMHTVTLVGIILLCLFIKQNQGLKCYDCDGNSDAKCNDQFDTGKSTSLLKKCGSGKDMCKKEKLKDKVKRSCVATAQCEEKDKDGTMIKCCKTKDGCNGASSVYVSSLLLLPIATTLFYIYK